MWLVSEAQQDPENTDNLSFGTKLFICLKDFQTLYTSDVYDLFPDTTYLD
jgi:hypothetical protein